MIVNLGKLVDFALSLIVEQLNKLKSKFLAHKSDYRNVYIIYYGEFIKFGTADAIFLFNMFRTWLDTFSNECIERICLFLDCCGRHLTLLPATATRMANMLEIMMSIKRSKPLDRIQDQMLGDAFYVCKPTHTASSLQKRQILKQHRDWFKYPPLLAFIRHLIWSEIDVASNKDLKLALVNLPYDKYAKELPMREGTFQNTVGSLELFVAQTCTNLSHVQFTQLHSLTAMLFHLQHHRPRVIRRVVDILLHDICSNADQPLQRQHLALAYIGHLVKRGMVHCMVAIEICYMLINCLPVYHPSSKKIAMVLCLFGPWISTTPLGELWQNLESHLSIIDAVSLQTLLSRFHMSAHWVGIQQCCDLLKQCVGTLKTNHLQAITTQLTDYLQLVSLAQSHVLGVDIPLTTRYLLEDVWKIYRRQSPPWQLDALLPLLMQDTGNQKLSALTEFTIANQLDHVEVASVLENSDDEEEEEEEEEEESEVCDLPSEESDEEGDDGLRRRADDASDADFDAELALLMNLPKPQASHCHISAEKKTFQMLIRKPTTSGSKANTFHVIQETQTMTTSAKQTNSKSHARSNLPTARLPIQIPVSVSFAQRAKSYEQSEIQAQKSMKSIIVNQLSHSESS